MHALSVIVNRWETKTHQKGKGGWALCIAVGGNYLYSQRDMKSWQTKAHLKQSSDQCHSYVFLRWSECEKTGSCNKTIWKQSRHGNLKMSEKMCFKKIWSALTTIPVISFWKLFNVAHTLSVCMHLWTSTCAYICANVWLCHSTV